MPKSTERFIFGHSLVSNSWPAKAKLDQFDQIDKHIISAESFGLFEIASPDFNTYYPDATPEDLKPQEGDYVLPLFRALSKIIINKYGPIDFAKGNVLKNSLNKLLGQTIYANHEMLVGNEVGVVTEVAWQNTRTQDGLSIPGGINARLKIDGKSHPRLARAVMANPPEVHSVSVTVSFAWEPSHKKMEKEDFLRALGTYDESGELIRRVVTFIDAYHEISFVPHGADPYAQRIDEDGNLNNPQYADSRQQFSMEDIKTYGHYLDYKDTELYITKQLSNDLEVTIPSIINNTDVSNKNNDAMNKELLKFLQTFFGLAEDATEDDVRATLEAELPIMRTRQEELTAELATAQNDLSAAQAQIPEEGALVLNSDEDKAKFTNYDEARMIADRAIQATRDDTNRLYKIVCNDNPDPSILALIDSANFETLTALNKQYKLQAEEKFQATCNECGSHDVSRTSTSSGDSGIVPHDDDGGDDNHPKTKSLDEVIDSFSKSKTPAAGNIHI